MTMENVFARISLDSRKIIQRNVSGKNRVSTAPKMQFVKMESAHALEVIRVMAKPARI